MQPYENLGVKSWGREWLQKTTKDPKGNTIHNFPKEEATHLLLNGGVMKVPITKYSSAFLEKVGKNLDDGYANYICEKRTHFFNMHTDLDILQKPDEEDQIVTVNNDNSVTPGPILKAWLFEIQNVMLQIYSKGAEFYPELRDPNMCGCTVKKCEHKLDRLLAVVCMSRPKRQFEKDKCFYSKIGVHVIWPFIQCDANFAETRIRKAWIQHFQKKFGLRPSYNIWEDIFDLTVYRQNGLRMVGSDKIEKCISCKGKKSKTGICEAGLCDGKNGCYPERRIYRVVDVLNSQGVTSPSELKMIQRSGTTEVQYSSIRSAKNKPTINSAVDMPEWFDPFFALDEAETHKDRFEPNKAKKIVLRQQIDTLRENKEGEENFLKAVNAVKKVKLDPDDPCVIVIQQWIRDTKLIPTAVLPEVYRKTDIIDVKRCSGKDSIPYYLVRIDSCFCMNVGREHNKNGVFFLINKYGLYQKCFCTCETTEGRANGKCKDYKSQVFAIPDYVTRVLFPTIYEGLSQLDECNINYDDLPDDQMDELISNAILANDQRYEQLNSRNKSYQLNKLYKGDKFELFEKRFHSKRK
jgi:hypothetical protein